MIDAVRREVAFRAHVKKVTATRVVTVGSSKTAAALGVPLGSQVEETIAWHRNPLRQLAWRFQHRQWHTRIVKPSQHMLAQLKEELGRG